MAEKPAILQDSKFTVEEGLAYRASRTGAIWMNKLFFSSLVLLVVWLLWGAAGGHTGCVEGVPQAPNEPIPGCDPVTSDCSPDQGQATQCSVFLTPTAKYLGAMAAITFLFSIAFGVLGLVVGKRIVAATPAADEVGARKPEAPHDEAQPPRP